MRKITNDFLSFRPSLPSIGAKKKKKEITAWMMRGEDARSPKDVLGWDNVGEQSKTLTKTGSCKSALASIWAK